MCQGNSKDFFYDFSAFLKKSKPAVGSAHDLNGVERDFRL